MSNYFSDKIKNNYMLSFRKIYLFSNAGISLFLIILAVITYLKHSMSLVIIVGLVLISMLNVGIGVFVKLKLLDVLVELEQVLADSDPTRKVNALRKKIPEKKNPGALDRMVIQIENSINTVYTSQLLRTQAEIHALQNQINPHFLYNTLETIRSQAIISKVPEIEEMSEALATIFRYEISSQGEMSTLAKELKCADDYLLIQQYRFKGRYKIIKAIDSSNEDLMKCRVPILTIQPILENAIVHGLEKKLDTGTITIRAEMTDAHIFIQISDDGIGMSEEVLEQLNKKLDSGDTLGYEPENRSKDSGSGIALLNVNQRIKHFFGNEYGLSVLSTVDVGTFVDIVLPNKQ
ncbi:MAG: histidine kinase [Eubacteriales bacterium]|nr:histidine kinase [Eubacteriales bacterium]